MKNLLSQTLALMIALLLIPQFSFCQESISINQMPKDFFQNWQGENGIWWFDIRPEFFGVDNRLWTYENITRMGDSYSVKVQDAFGNTKEFYFKNIRSDGMTASENYGKRHITLGPKPFDISFLELSAADLPNEFRGNWSSPYGCGESVEISPRGITVNGGEWELHQIIREMGRHRVYLKNGDNYWLWLPDLPRNNRLKGVFNDRISLAQN